VLVRLVGGVGAKYCFLFGYEVDNIHARRLPFPLLALLLSFTIMEFGVNVLQ